MATRTFQKYTCKVCNFNTREEEDFVRHFYNAHGVNKHCNICNKQHRNRIRHALHMHAIREIGCTYCNEIFQNHQDLLEHISIRHDVPQSNSFQETVSAFRRKIQTFTTTCIAGACLSLENFFLEKRDDMVQLIRRQLVNKLLIRCSVIVYGNYVKYDHLGAIDEVINIPLRSTSQRLMMADMSDVPRFCALMEQEILTRHDQFINTGSGWVLHHITKGNIEICQLSMRGGCGSTAVYKLNREMRKCISNVHSKKKDCFLNAVSLALAPPETLHFSKAKKYLTVKQLAKTLLHTKHMPKDELVSLKDIRKFEGKNAGLNIGINVYTIETNKHLYPVYKSRFDCAPQVVNLLLIPYKSVHHFVLITNLNKLNRVCNPLGYRKNYICDHCMNGFSRPEALLSHEMTCTKLPKMKTVIPVEGMKLEFTQHARTIPLGITGFADFESSLKPISQQQNGETYNCDNCRQNGDKSACKHKSFDVHEQVASTYCVILINWKGEIIFEKTHSSDTNLLHHFFQTLQHIEEEFIPQFQKHKKLTVWTAEDDALFKQSTKCYMCRLPFHQDNFKLRKVRDHCHYTNRFLGAAHSFCNFKRKRDISIPIFIHNFRNYDGQFIKQGLKYTDKVINALPFNMEKFRTMQIGKIVFVDSIQMLSGSLSMLVTNLAKSGHDFPILSSSHIYTSEKQRQLLLRKGVYPYEWASSVALLEDTKSLPAQKCFYSALSESNISEEEYRHAQEVFSEFQCKNMREYCDLYCKLDTILLAEVMSAFRKMVLEEFGLDCMRYISLPQLSWDAMLRTLTEPIDYMTDPDMILMCEQNIRGGVSFVGERMASSTESQKTSEDTIQDTLLYIDANNLYSLAQSQPMPARDFAWTTSAELEWLQANLLSIPPDAETGCILEVDLEYPPHLHPSHKDLPLAPQQEAIHFPDLSPFSSG